MKVFHRPPQAMAHGRRLPNQSDMSSPLKNSTGIWNNPACHPVLNSVHAVL
jgi:hypothetical protein